MNIYIFEDVKHCSDREHEDGGVVVIAESMHKVIDMIKDEEHVSLEYNDWNHVEIYELKDDNCSPKIIIFQDSGCC